MSLEANGKGEMEPESSRPAKAVTFQGSSSAQERDSGNSQGFCVLRFNRVQLCATYSGPQRLSKRVQAWIGWKQLIARASTLIHPPP